MNKTKIFKILFNGKIVNKSFSSNIDNSNFKKLILEKVSSIKDTNIRDYYNRRYEYDFNNNKISDSNQIKEELAKLDRIVTIQNMYFSKSSILD